MSKDRRVAFLCIFIIENTKLNCTEDTGHGRHDWRIVTGKGVYDKILRNNHLIRS